jgi:hypothetical protein
MSGFGSWRIRDSGTIEHVGVFDLIGLDHEGRQGCVRRGAPTA